MLGKHRESTDPIGEGFLEYAAGAMVRRVPSRGNYISEGGGQGVWDGVAGLGGRGKWIVQTRD